MAIKKIYKNGTLELELHTSEKGIHLNISHEVSEEIPPIEFIIESEDVNEFLFDIEKLSELLENGNE